MPANSVSGYDIENSVRFNAGSKDHFRRTFVAGNRRTFTYSTWVKRSSLGDQNLINADDGTAFNNNGNFSALYFTSGDLLFAADYTGSQRFSLQTTGTFRDTSAWYHIVLATDTTQETAADRMKMYVNGERQTAFNSASYPDRNLDTQFNHADNGMKIGVYPDQDLLYWHGYMAETHFIDGAQLTPEDFGKVNNDGVWVPIKYQGGNYGNNGFYLEFQQTGTSQNASGIGADTSGEEHHLAVHNFTADSISIDTPTNNFPTWNVNDSGAAASTITDGALRATQPGSGSSTNTTMGVVNGKWYYEVKITAQNNPLIGIVPQAIQPGGSDNFQKEFSIGVYAGNPNLYQNTASPASLGGGLSTGDILMFAIDMDNSEMYIGKNGSWNDGLGGGFDQSDFANANGYSFNRPAGPSNDFYVVSHVNGSGSNGYTLELNFGSPPFTLDSANADGEGIGNFEYAVPSDYFAMCTKNLAKYG